MLVCVSTIDYMNVSLPMFLFVSKTVIWILQFRVSDLDLDEEEVLKFASFGNGANHQDTIDVLRRSLVMRNR